MGEQYAELARLLGRVRRRWRAAAALRAWTMAAALATLVLALALATQLWLAPQGGAIVALWSTAVLIAAACVGWAAWSVGRWPDDRRLARYVEECCPELEDALVTAVAQRGAASSSPMADMVLGDAVRRTRGLDLDRVVSRRALRMAGLRAATATLALALAAAFAFTPATQAARLLALYLFPARLVVDVVPGDVKMRAGQPLKIVARLAGGVPGLVPVLRLSGECGAAPCGPREMQPEADGFVVAFEAIEESFTYAVAAAGTTSRDYTVTVVRPPNVEQIDLRYEYPATFGMAPRVEEDGGDIYGPTGTRVRLVVHTDKPVTEAALTLAGGQRVPLTVHGERLEGELTIADDGSYRVALADADGLANPGETEYFIRTLEDRPPDVRIVKPASDRKATPIEEVPIEARADDDFGVAALDLVYAVRGGEEKVVPFTRTGGGLTVNGHRTVYLEDLGVRPGDFVTYYARARDVSRGKRSSEARSDIFFLEVTPFEEEFVAAQTNGGAGSQDEKSIEDLVEAEKEIITATWKLDRRGRDAGSRSQDDIRTIASAQAELRKRAMSHALQMRRASDLRRRRPGVGRGTQPAEPSADAMGKAADAMGKAAEQLEALSTAAALPHEMTALNELLRAQAEVRRREVQRQQQQAGNGNGMNRQQQDLSSLFDRELARQQQTNYETPNSRETRPEQRNQADELEKVRELARRQDALNREQQELAKKQAGGQQTEEMKRQLERLTREQSELRRQAEELARQLQQAQQAQAQGQQDGRGGQQGRQDGQGQPQAGRAMQQASEEMQSAANELRRQDAQEASARGTRALERLRELEQQLRGGQPDDRRRALGEMQLESRQLAEAQRRMAGDGTAARGDSDAQRRRAGEQRRLADRMQRLEQAVREMARERGQGSGGRGQAAGARGQEDARRNALAEAARELERQKLSERMKSQIPDPNAQAGQQIARELDRLSERLGAANGQGGESEQLSEQLSRIREMREQLAQLERQLSDLSRNGERNPGQRGERGEGQQQGSQSAQNGRQGQGGELGGDENTPWDGARELLESMKRDLEYRSPEASAFNPGRSAPGTEAWKQDFAEWQELKVQLAAALERAEGSAAARLRTQQAADRLQAGAAQSVPEQYRRMVDQYYRALAAQEKR